MRVSVTLPRCRQVATRHFANKVKAQHALCGGTDSPFDVCSLSSRSVTGCTHSFAAGLVRWQSSTAPASSANGSDRRKRMQDRMLSLRDFTVRAQVLGLYRRYIRVVKTLPTHAQTSAREHIRQAFRQHGTLAQPKSTMNIADKRALLSEGEKQLKYLSSYVSTAADNAMFGNASIDIPNNLPQTGVHAPDADGGVKDDVRGRIGSAWPWQS